MVEMTSSGVDKNQTLANIEKYWDDWYVKGLAAFVRVPNLTPRVNPDFLRDGMINVAIDLVDNYVIKI